MAGERHGHGMLCVNRPLTARHGMGAAWAQHAMCESAFNVLIAWNSRSFNFLELSGSVQACTGFVLPLYHWRKIALN
jgi:hypothetical protein